MLPDISDAVLPWVIGVGSLAVFSAAWTALGLVVFTSHPYRRLRDRIAGKLSGRTVLVAEGGCDDCSVEPGERHRYAGCPGNVAAVKRKAGLP